MNLKEYCEKNGIDLSNDNMEFYGTGEVRELHQKNNGQYLGWKLSMIGNQTAFLLENPDSPRFSDTIEGLGEEDVIKWWEENAEKALTF